MSPDNVARLQSLAGQAQTNEPVAPTSLFVDTRIEPMLRAYDMHVGAWHAGRVWVQDAVGHGFHVYSDIKAVDLSALLQYAAQRHQDGRMQGQNEAQAALRQALGVLT